MLGLGLKALRPNLAALALAVEPLSLKNKVLRNNTALSQKSWVLELGVKLSESPHGLISYGQRNANRVFCDVAFWWGHVEQNGLMHC